MLYFCKRIISFQTYFSSISCIHNLLHVTLCLQRVFGAHYPLRHWLPLTVRMPLTRRINLDSSKRKVEQLSFRKYSCCDAWRVTDINLLYVNCDQQRRRSACMRSLNSMVWLNSKLIIMRSGVTNLWARGVAGSNLSKGAASWLQTNTWLIAWYWFNQILRSTKFWIIL